MQCSAVQCVCVSDRCRLRLLVFSWPAACSCCHCYLPLRVCCLCACECVRCMCMCVCGLNVCGRMVVHGWVIAALLRLAGWLLECFELKPSLAIDDFFPIFVWPNEFLKIRIHPQPRGGVQLRRIRTQSDHDPTRHMDTAVGRPCHPSASLTTVITVTLVGVSDTALPLASVGAIASRRHS